MKNVFTTIEISKLIQALIKELDVAEGRTEFERGSFAALKSFQMAIDNLYEKEQKEAERS